jgi:ectoine hydroxylase-related dioxygenase (phytanoyl-CoA dioxygenase family)
MQKERGGITEEPGDIIEDAVEIHLKAGDALLFNDALCHGSAQRTNPGQRRMFVLRYVPSLLGHRFGYVPSDELLARLTPERRAIVQPIVPRQRPTATA